jgi:two-component system response regulator FixJ
MPDGQAKVFVVDDDEAVRRSLARLLRSAGLAVESFASAGDFLARDGYDGVGCIVLDVRMPDLDGMALQARLGDQACDLPIVFLTGHGDIPMSVRAMKKGAFDFLTKPVDEDVLLGAVRQGLAQHRAERVARLELEALRVQMDMLTPREQAVLRGVIAGARNKQIGASLDIAEKTVKIHRGRAMQKLGVSSLAELIQICQRLGIEPSPDVKRSGSDENVPHA